MKKFQGENILEVWDWRLSKASPTFYREKTWIIAIHANDSPDYDGTPNSALEVYDTGIEVEENDIHDKEKLIVCYEWLYSVRDKYALDDIEERKPLVGKINQENLKLSQSGEV